MTIELYVFEDEEGNRDSFSTRDPKEAGEYARQYGRAWIAQQYEFADSEIVADFRERIEAS